MGLWPQCHTRALAPLLALVGTLLAPAALPVAHADWTMRCANLAVQPPAHWLRLRANGTVLSELSPSGEGAEAYAPPLLEGVGTPSSCIIRLAEADSRTNGVQLELFAASTLSARNVRVRVTTNAAPSPSAQGDYVVAVRARGGDANKHGIFVRLSYANNSLQVVRKASTSLALTETVLGSTSITLNTNAPNVLEVVASKNTIIARVFDGSGVTLLGSTSVTDSTAGFRRGMVYVGGERRTTAGGTPLSGIDLSFDNISVVDLSRALRFGSGNQPTLAWTLPTNGTQGRFAFSNTSTNPLGPATTRFQWIPMDITSGPSLTDFRARAIADLDQDGAGDVLYHNLATGVVRRAAFSLRGALASAPAQRISSTLLSVPTGWTLAAAADFTGDGHADLLWQNDATNAAGLITMQRTTPSVWQGLSYVPPPFRVVGTADFDLDGNFDLLWQDSTNGAVYIGRMNRTSYLSFPYLGVANPAQWRVMGTLDENFDDVPDVLWQNTQTGEVGVWLLNSAGNAIAQWKSITTLSTSEWRGAN